MSEKAHSNRAKHQPCLLTGPCTRTPLTGQHQLRLVNGKCAPAPEISTSALFANRAVCSNPLKGQHWLRLPSKPCAPTLERSTSALCADRTTCSIQMNGQHRPCLLTGRCGPVCYPVNSITGTRTAHIHPPPKTSVHGLPRTCRCQRKANSSG